MNMTEQTTSVCERIEVGPGMRLQRALEGLMLLVAIFTNDVRPAWVVLGLFILQVISPRLAPGALLVALLHRRPERHHISHIYNDFQGIRGACAASTVLMALGLYFLHGGHSFGWAFIACPAASCILAPAVGFCAGCTCYVVARDLCTRLKIIDNTIEGARDVVLESDSPRHQ